jgi:hypothetical protein
MAAGMKQASSRTCNNPAVWVPFCPILVQRTGSPKRPWPKRFLLLGSSRGYQARRSWIGNLKLQIPAPKLHAQVAVQSQRVFAFSLGKERAPPLPRVPGSPAFRSLARVKRASHPCHSQIFSSDFSQLLTKCAEPSILDTQGQVETMKAVPNLRRWKLPRPPQNKAW